MTVAITPKGVQVVPHDIAEMLIRCGKYDHEVTITVAYKLLSYKKPLPSKEEVYNDIVDEIYVKRNHSPQTFCFTQEEAEAIAKRIVYGKEDVA